MLLVVGGGELAVAGLLHSVHAQSVVDVWLFDGVGLHCGLHGDVVGGVLEDSGSSDCCLDLQRRLVLRILGHLTIVE